MKKIIIAAIFLASANIESYYFRFFEKSIKSQDYNLQDYNLQDYNFSATPQAASASAKVSKLFQLQNKINIFIGFMSRFNIKEMWENNSIKLTYENMVGLKPLGSEEIIQEDLQYVRSFVIRSINENFMIYANLKSIMHNSFFKFKLATVVQRTWTKKTDTPGDNTYTAEDFESKCLVWDPKTHTNLKYSAAVLGAGLAYAAYSKWFK